MNETTLGNRVMAAVSNRNEMGALDERADFALLREGQRRANDGARRAQAAVALLFRNTLESVAVVSFIGALRNQPNIRHATTCLVLGTLRRGSTNGPWSARLLRAAGRERLKALPQITSDFMVPAVGKSKGVADGQPFERTVVM